jgi:phosphoribosyl 1,2-cyclic phosphodiesterase
MCLYIASLNSGSNGNCYYIGNDDEAILIDAGISCREIEKRMKRLGLLMNKVKAVFISHEHSDHICGVTVLSRKYKLPVYITEATLQYSGLMIEQNLVRIFNAEEPVNIGKLSIIPFVKFHDASDPHSFMIECNKIQIGIFTDIGVACEKIIKFFKQCHAVFLEANYDEQMLEAGRYPYHLKKRIRSTVGHLSNNAALQLFLEHRSPFLSHLILSHLSKNNNRPELVSELFNQYAGATKIVVASRYKETNIFQIEGGHINSVIQFHKPLVQKEQLQLTLF